MSGTQAEILAVLRDRIEEDARSGRPMAPEVRAWIARHLTAADVLAALRERPEVGRALVAGLVIAGPWRDGGRGTMYRDALWPSRLSGPSFFASSRQVGSALCRAAIYSATGMAIGWRHFEAEQEAHQWCDERLLARGVVLLDELPGGER